ncbi:MAG TPA: ABC transporter permease [Saprospiraceae bacterium]|nr:ABC transporter permease [Saprospiraceae bacterium]HMQ82838.1 ABC transporter permease [Saprospiraceae bacterium]
MYQYLLKRIFIFIPTLLVISLLAFGLSKMAPGDPVELFLRDRSGDVERDLINADRIYQETARYLGLDKPAFYFSISPAAIPDTLHAILNPIHQENLRKLIQQYGNWPQISGWYDNIRILEYEMAALPPALATGTPARNVKANLRQLYVNYQDHKISSLLGQIRQGMEQDSLLKQSLAAGFTDLMQSYQRVKSQKTRQLLYVPDLKWFGLNNQYHCWLTNFMRLDFGKSYYDNRPVADKIADALYWTILINCWALFFSYLIAIPIGVFSAIRKDTFYDRFITLLLFILHSLPNFWIATLLVVFFTTPEYGMDWFPSLGLGDLPKEAPFGDRFLERSAHLFLPVLCLTYGTLAFISRQMRGGVLNVIRQDYIRTARAKGLSEQTVIWKHAFRNALFPIITMFAGVLPAIFAGSLVIEVIFNIPGMGKLTVDGILSRDWPLVYALLMITAVLTMAGILIADILYARFDPRVSYSSKK